MNRMSRREKSFGARSFGSSFVLILGMAWSVASPAEQLPVFKLAEPKVDQSRATVILANLQREKPGFPAKSEDNGSVFIASAGSKEVEVYKASGGVFLRDTKQLWNPNLRPQLPSREKAKVLADKFLAENKLLPGEDGHVKVSFAEFTETGVAADIPGKLDKKILDIQANYKADLLIEKTTGQKLVMPVVGGGGDFKVAIGDRGAVIGFLGGWRPIAEIASTEEILPKAEAEAKFKGVVGNANVTKDRIVSRLLLGARL
jgi:hypothetical protein